MQRALLERSAQGELRLLEESARTAVLAAAALGVEVGAIANSLVFAVPVDGTRRAVLVMTSGAHRVDPPKLAARLGVMTLERATPEFVRAETGFAIGGVPPLGHSQPLQTVIDEALAAYPVLWAAAGHPRAVFSTDYSELVRLTSGEPMAVN